MKERIRDLAEQAWIDTKEEFDSIVDDGGSINFTFAHAYDKKFAELIVRECADLCDNLILKGTEHDLTYNDGVMDCAIILKQHFGVEE